MNFIKKLFFLIATTSANYHALNSILGETNNSFSNKEVDTALIVHALEHASIIGIDDHLFLGDGERPSTTKEIFYGYKAYDAVNYFGTKPAETEWATAEEAFTSASTRKDTTFIIVAIPTCNYKSLKPSQQTKLVEYVKKVLSLLKKTNTIKPVVILLQKENGTSFINSLIIDNAQVAGIISFSSEWFNPCQENDFELRKTETSSCPDDCSDFGLSNPCWEQIESKQEEPIDRMIPHNGFAINMHGTPVVYGMNFVLWAKLLQKIGIALPSTVQEELASAADSFVMSPWHENYTKWSYLYNRLYLLKCINGTPQSDNFWPMPASMIDAQTKAEYNL